MDFQLSKTHLSFHNDGSAGAPGSSYLVGCNDFNSYNNSLSKKTRRRDLLSYDTGLISINHQMGTAELIICCLWPHEVFQTGQHNSSNGRGLPQFASAEGIKEYAGNHDARVHGDDRAVRGWRIHGFAMADIVNSGTCYLPGGAGAAEPNGTTFGFVFCTGLRIILISQRPSVFTKLKFVL